ncbi:MAG TPA: PAS domain S-box protein, partial [Candidatus Sulfotelmatobacter sp.]|nr:PAS domain S-box protein [Candidatus Sulfotelmatobacter sp.]
MAAGIDKLNVQTVCRWIAGPPLVLAAAAVISAPSPGHFWLALGSASAVILAWWPVRWPARFRLLVVLAGSVTLGYGIVVDYENRNLFNLMLHLLVLMGGAYFPWSEVGLSILAAGGAYVSARYTILFAGVWPYDWPTALTDGLGYALLGALVYALAEGQRKIQHLHKLLENRSRQTETELQRTLEASRDIVMISSFDGRVLSISPACREILGYEPGEMTGRNLEDFIHPEDQAPGRERRRAMVGRERPFRFEIRYLHKDGHTVWLDWNAYADIGAGLFRSVARDVTERKQADHLLAESEQRYRALFDCNPDIILVGSLDDGMVSANPAFLELTGHDPTEIARLDRSQRMDHLFEGLPHER